MLNDSHMPIYTNFTIFKNNNFYNVAYKQFFSKRRKSHLSVLRKVLTEFFSIFPVDTLRTGDPWLGEPSRVL